MPLSKPTNAPLNAFIQQYLPAASVSALPGLSGGSYLIDAPGARYLLRQRAPEMPRYAFARHFRALRRLPANLVPVAHRLEGNWLLLEYLPGEIKNDLPPLPRLASLLYHLHCQRRLGWRIVLTPLLWRDWQRCAPARRTPFWLRQLRALTARSEPQPLRIAPLHMDIHPGNLLWQQDRLRLLDWEYAGDGDIALELASVAVSGSEREALVATYAQAAHINECQLRQQIQRWRPWVSLLMAGWYERRYQQTREPQFIALADEAWRQARAE